MNATAPAKIFPKNNFEVAFSFGRARRRITMSADKNGLGLLPNDQETFFSKTVYSALTKAHSKNSLDTEKFDEIMGLIDAGGSETKLVPVQLVGKGSSALVAKYKIEVVHNVARGVEFGCEKTKTLEFSLPRSQIIEIDENLYAPLWLVLKELEKKQTSKWGEKYRAENDVGHEFVPAPARAISSKRTEALKVWLIALRAELRAEDVAIGLAAAEEKASTDLLVQSRSEIIMDDLRRNPIDGPSIRMGVFVSLRKVFPDLTNELRDKIIDNVQQKLVAMRDFAN